MKTIIYIFLFIFILPHDAPLAFFKIYKSDKEVVLEITFDTDVLSKELKITTTELDVNSVQAYLEKHTNFEFDSCASKPTVQKVNHKNGHTNVFCVFYDISDYKNNISIKNDCLNSITNHSNIVEIKINSTTREFRMNKNRTKINVDL